MASKQPATNPSTPNSQTDEARILNQAAEIIERIADDQDKIDNPNDELHSHRLRKAADLLTIESERLAQGGLF